MPHTPLQEALATHPNGLQPVAAADYRGTTVASRFSTPQAEFEALQNGCGVYDLGFRARLALTGHDRVRWMNGMVTNNIRDLAAGRGVYSFLLNPQGHILGDMFVFNDGERLLVETDRSQVEKITAAFDHYIIMDDVEVANLGDEMTALGIAGPKAHSVLAAAGIQQPELEPLQAVAPACDCDCGCVQCTVMRGEDAGHESFEIWLHPKDVYNTWIALLKAGATPVGSETLEMQRIARGIPLYGVDIRERDLPQETEQARALSFNKGCYVGQEIVERIRSRGNVHRKFSGFVVAGAAEITRGAKVMAGEKEVGEVTSVASLPAGKTMCLGYIRREVGTPGRTVSIGGADATVVVLSAATASRELEAEAHRA